MARREKRICDFCNKVEYYTPIDYRYVIWVVSPLKNQDGSYFENENGNLVVTRTYAVDAKEELINQPVAKAYADKYVIPKLHQYESVEFEKVKLYRNLFCPSCRKAHALYKKNVAKANRERKQKGIKVLTPQEAHMNALKDINYQIALERKKAEEAKKLEEAQNDARKKAEP